MSDNLLYVFVGIWIYFLLGMLFIWIKRLCLKNKKVNCVCFLYFEQSQTLEKIIFKVKPRFFEMVNCSVHIQRGTDLEALADGWHSAQYPIVIFEVKNGKLVNAKDY